MELVLQLGNLLIAANLGLLVSSYMLKDEAIIKMASKPIFYLIIVLLVSSSILTLASSDYLFYNWDLASKSYAVIFWSYAFLFLAGCGLLAISLQEGIKTVIGQNQKLQDLRKKLKSILQKN
jgi:hypothetical protein